MMKKIGKVFGLLILMLMLGVAGAGIYDWGKDRWVAPVSQKMEGEVRPNAEVEEQRRLLKERRSRSRETSRPPPRPPISEQLGGRWVQETSRPPPRPPPGSVAEVEEERRLAKERIFTPPPTPLPGSVAEMRIMVRELGRLLQEHNRQIAELDDRIMCLQLWITNNPGREWKDCQQPGHPLC